MLELYSLSRLVESELGEVEEHLLVCPDCRDSVTLLDRYHSVLKDALRQARPEIQATEDGLIYKWVEPLPDGRCKARHRGPTLDGGGEFDMDRQAWAYLRRSFTEMFPRHRCNKRCSRRV